MITLEQFKAEVISQREAVCMACHIAQPCEPLGATDSHGKCFCGANHAPLRRYIAVPHLRCPKNKWAALEIERPPTAPEFGPGTNLKEMLEALFGVGAINGCGCEAVIRQMNQWGVEGCRAPKNFEYVVTHLMEQKDKLSELARQYAEQEHKPTLIQRTKLACARVATVVSPNAAQRVAMTWLVNTAIDRAAAAASVV